MKHTFNTAFGSTMDDILSSIGLERQHRLGPLSSFAVGALVGAAAGMLLAPTSGEELVATLAERAKTLRSGIAKSLGTTDEDGASDKFNRTRSPSSSYTPIQSEI